VGIYDRDYFRQERPGFSLSLPHSAVATIVLLNVGVYLAEMLFGYDVVYWLSAHVSTLTRPWMWWQFVTYGFVHDPRSLMHIAFNMLTLWFLGPPVEQRLGKNEFLRFYLVALVAGSVVWTVANKVIGTPTGPLLGASGAVAATVILFALLYPHQTLLVMFVLPMPAWLVAILAVSIDMLGAMHIDVMGTAGWHRGVEVAFSVHLVGAAMALLYHQQGWNLGRLLSNFRWPHFRFRPPLRVHHPEVDDDPAAPDDEVDRILEKIHRDGEGSLTRHERRVLENASREYQRRRRS
jgi:membrane associated rhomboid family serine protease